MSAAGQLVAALGLLAWSWRLASCDERASCVWATWLGPPSPVCLLVWQLEHGWFVSRLPTCFACACLGRRDHHLQAIVLAVRGTHSFKDLFTSLTGALDGVVLLPLLLTIHPACWEGHHSLLGAHAFRNCCACIPWLRTWTEVELPGTTPAAARHAGLC